MFVGSAEEVEIDSSCMTLPPVLGVRLALAAW